VRRLRGQTMLDFLPGKGVWLGFIRRGGLR
jgi:hypothetical protein